MREKHELVKRYFFFFLGIFSNALGVAFITKAMLGTGPTTCIPYVLSLKFAELNLKMPLSFGLCNFIFNLFLLLLQILILRRKFQKNQLLQIPVALLFSVCIDVAMALCGFIKIDNYLMALVYTVLGCVLRAYGVSCQVVADVVMQSPEAFVKAVADSIKKEFSFCKLISDGLMAVIAIVLSFVFFGKLQAVREGTLITVILVGPVSKIFTRRLGFANHYFENDGDLVYETKFKLQQGKRLVITITSEAGSGGRVIAGILGSILGIPVYDKELVDMVAEYGNYSPSYVLRHNEKLYSNAAQAFIMENYSFSEEDFESYRKLFETQCQVISNIAQEKDCIIVGHCSNYVLKDFPGALHIFITAEMNQRIEYIKEKYSISGRRAIEKIEGQDEDTLQYYRHFTGWNWKDGDHYNICMDSGLFGHEGTAEMIEQIVKKNYIDLPKVKVKELIKKYHLNQQDKS